MQPFIFGITDETHSMLTCMTTTSSASYCEAMQFFSIPLDAMQFCKDLLAENCDYLEVLDAREAVAYSMDHIVTSPPQVREMVGTPILNATGAKVGVLCAASSYLHESLDTCRRALGYYAAHFGVNPFKNSVPRSMGWRQHQNSFPSSELPCLRVCRRSIERHTLH